MEIGEIGYHGHHVLALVVVLYKNPNVYVIIQSNIIFVEYSNLIEFGFFRPENGGQYCSGQSTRIRSCEDNPVNIYIY
jgi:hypothetical protein